MGQSSDSGSERVNLEKCWVSRELSRESGCLQKVTLKLNEIFDLGDVTAPLPLLWFTRVLFEETLAVYPGLSG